VFLNSNRTLDRKLREAVLAMALEWKFSKQQILELYLNKVYFGGGAYGIDSASRKFFSHSARDLSTAEAAIIAGMVKAPSRYSPTADVDAAVGRANVVLEQMRKYGALGADEAAAVDVSAVKLSREGGQNSARYFTDYVLPQLDLLLPNRQLRADRGLDHARSGMQRAAARRSRPMPRRRAGRARQPRQRRGDPRAGRRHGLRPVELQPRHRGAAPARLGVEAVRLPDRARGRATRPRTGRRRAGDDRRLEPAQLEAAGSPAKTNVRTAFAYSINTVAAQLGNEVGFSSVAGMARRFGITTPINTNPSMVLGSSGSAGDRPDPRVRRGRRRRAVDRALRHHRVVSSAGEVLYRHQDTQPYQLVPDYVAAGITDLLQTAVNTGTGRAAQIGRPVAGKTGTTSSNKDGWFVGFSSGVTTGVWMGRDDAKAVPGLQGGTAPARAFADFMRIAVRAARSQSSTPRSSCPNGRRSPTRSGCMASRATTTTTSTSRAS
jgi:penicillin-binding protein 1A